MDKLMTHTVKVGSVTIGGGAPLALIAGPCVIEGRQACVDFAGELKQLAVEENIPFIFKASYDKANRSSGSSFRGPGLDEGLDILREIKDSLGVPVLTDIHGVEEVEPAAEVADIIQIPAFLCRQTDLLIAAGKSRAVVNIKKGQFLAPWDMGHVIEKVESAGNKDILVTERGSSFGYNNLVADMRSLLVLKEYGHPVIFDATHSVQLPGEQGSQSGGRAEWAPYLARAAVAVGCDAVFMETHPNPVEAKSDSATMLPFGELREVWNQLRAIDNVVS